MKPTSVGNWKHLNEELYDLCDEIMQQINQEEEDGEDPYVTFVNAASKLAFHIRQIERDLGV